MSKRQKQAHAEKVAKRDRWFPKVSEEEIKARYDVAHTAAHLVGEFIELGLVQGKVEPEFQHMFGAHYTIAQYVLNRMTDVLARELDLVHNESNLIAVTAPLVGPDGKPLTKN